MNVLNAHLNNITVPISKVSQPEKKEEVVIKENVTSNKKNYKTIATVAGAATLAIVFAGIGIKNKPKKLQDIMFENGKAFFKKNGKGFSGKVKDVLKNGDTVILEYKDGIIQKSKRSGKVNVMKVYDRSGLDKIVHIFNEGKETSVNLSKKINDTKKLIAENARKKAEARVELQRKLTEKDLLVQKAKETQDKFNAQFDKMLSHKSAESSAAVIEAGCKRREELSQMAYNAPFEVALSNKSAKESAETFRTEIIKRKKSTLENYYGDKGIAMRTISSKNAVVKESYRNGSVYYRDVTYGLDGTFPEGNTDVWVKNSSKISRGEYYDGTKTTNTLKHFTKNEKGKHKIQYREKIISGRSGIEESKIVQKLPNGYSQTAIDDYNQRTTKIIIRDKKGNIISETLSEWKKPWSNGGAEPKDLSKVDEKLLAPWYKNYRKLCQKFGESERPCGVIGGAWDHYIELCKWNSDPDGMLRQILNKNERVEYDPKARLENLIKIHGFNSSEVQQYTEMLNNGQLSLDDLLLFIDKNGSKISDKMKKILDRIRDGQLDIKDIADTIKDYLLGNVTISQLLKKAGVPEANIYQYHMPCQQNVQKAISYVYI